MGFSTASAEIIEGFVGALEHSLEVAVTGFVVSFVGGGGAEVQWLR